MPKTLAEKVWDAHVVDAQEGRPKLLFIDLHLVHEVTSPQAFEGLRLAGRKVRHPELSVATIDHNIPTSVSDPEDPVSVQQMQAIEDNCEEFGIRLYGKGDPEQGIVHVIGPEQGLTQPGMTIVCGDSHTSTHGAFGALAFGIGTSEVEHVLATQTLPQNKPKTLAINVNGELPKGSTAKDIVLAIIAKIGTGGGIGSIIEFRGSAIEALSMEGRMTVCNMSIEAGARAGMIGPDEKTFEYLRAGRSLRLAKIGIKRSTIGRACQLMMGPDLIKKWTLTQPKSVRRFPGVLILRKQLPSTSPSLGRRTSKMLQRRTQLLGRIGTWTSNQAPT